MVTLRIRSLMWFASGITVALLAVAVFSGVRARAGEGPGLVEASFVAITPCRLLDTRPAPNTVGPRATPIGSGQHHFQQVTGVNGNCNIPFDATAIALNVTAVDPTAGTFLTIYPADAGLPTASNLNVRPGDGPSPNKVDVDLSGAGAIRVYNNAGLVNVIADIAGYYTPNKLTSLQNQINALKPTGPGSVIVTAADFVPTQIGGLGWESPFGSRTGGAGVSDNCVVARAHLPNGVTVTSVKLYAFDSSNIASINASLDRNPFGVGNAIAMANTPVTTNTGHQFVEDTTISNAIVDNERYSYVIESCFLNNADTRLHDVVIEFTYPN